MNAVIRSTGLWTPDESVSNEELVECFNAWVEKHNAEHADAIERGCWARRLTGWTVCR